MAPRNSPPLEGTSAHFQCSRLRCCYTGWGEQLGEGSTGAAAVAVVVAAVLAAALAAVACPRVYKLSSGLTQPQWLQKQQWSARRYDE
jgi:hypothetical protein